VEVATLSNKLGLNQWELNVGLIPWLERCKKGGLLSHIDGHEIDANNPEFWVTLLKKISHREGIGDTLAEGVPRAANILGKGKDIVKELYPAYGFSGHWDGHGDRYNEPFFPFWITAAIQWATDTRDPLNSGHGYVQNFTWWSKVRSWKDLMRIAEIVYGSKKAADPYAGYEFKAEPAIWHQHESILKDSLLLCDQAWPRVYDLHTDDHYARVTIPGHGRIDGKIGPTGKRESLDRKKFTKLMDTYYDMRGWDKNTGWPTAARLRELGLADVAEGLEKLLPQSNQQNTTE